MAFITNATTLQVISKRRLLHSSCYRSLRAKAFRSLLPRKSYRLTVLNA